MCGWRIVCRPVEFLGVRHVAATLPSLTSELHVWSRACVCVLFVSRGRREPYACVDFCLRCAIRYYMKTMLLLLASARVQASETGKNVYNYDAIVRCVLYVLSMCPVLCWNRDRLPKYHKQEQNTTHTTHCRDDADTERIAKSNLRYITLYCSVVYLIQKIINDPSDRNIL